ncbi:MAG TPA: hypothetical protein VN818_11265 [Gammaproteobacteria bacterium]|nr:hypothetical protein [Gammaproteobacteria bacterium]
MLRNVRGVPPALAFGDDDAELLEGGEWQLGVAAARNDGLKILGFAFDAVGIAYPFADHSSGIRFYLSSVF